ncbi:MAG: hypothetical protein JWM27_103 [Gemmatimonadetes bacterium]|nr:hypothetical protein [Gemmatimonadota bacterium]
MHPSAAKPKRGRPRGKLYPHRVIARLTALQNSLLRETATELQLDPGTLARQLITDGLAKRVAAEVEVAGARAPGPGGRGAR